MPNQRSKDKRHLGGFVHKKLYVKVLRFAKKDGMDHDRFGFCAKLITEGIEKLEKERIIRPPEGSRLLKKTEIIKTGDTAYGGYCKMWFETGCVGMRVSRATKNNILAYARPLKTKKGSK